jgi:hypothetical protein
MASGRTRAGSLLIFGLALAACARRGSPAPGNEAGASNDQLANLRVVLSTEVAIAAETGGSETVRRPWVGPIVEALAEDHPDDFSPLQKQTAGKLTADPGRLFARGLDNLRRASPQPIETRTIEVAKARVQVTQFPGSYTAARLLLPELWSPIAAKGGGHLYAAAPARDIVLWTTSLAKDDQLALRRQAHIAFLSRSYPISPAILRWTGSGWALEDANQQD